MSYAFPPLLGRLIQEELDSGLYRSEDEVLVEAMQALRDRDQTLVGLREGLADFESGRVHLLCEADAFIREKHGIIRDS